MKTIVKIIDKRNTSFDGAVNLFGVLEDGGQVNIQVMDGNVVIPIFTDGNKPFGKMFFTSQNDYVLSESVKQELKDVYYVNYFGGF